MNSFWSAAMVLSGLVAAAQGLTCRQCPVGVFGRCLFGSDVTCGNGTESCFRGEAQFNATEALTLHIRGCLDSDLCEKTLTGNILGAGYTSSFTCCTSDLCNSAASARLPLAAVLAVAALCSLWNMWPL